MNEWGMLSSTVVGRAVAPRDFAYSVLWNLCSLLDLHVHGLFIFRYMRLSVENILNSLVFPKCVHIFFCHYSPNSIMTCSVNNELGIVNQLVIEMCKRISMYARTSPFFIKDEHFLVSVFTGSLAPISWKCWEAILLYWGQKRFYSVIQLRISRWEEGSWLLM